MNNLPTKSTNAKSCGVPVENAFLLTARQLRLSYPDKQGQNALTVLQNFDLHLKSGEIVAILGPSGVGKSSLLRVLAGLQKPQSGQIQLRGRQLNGPRPELGFVFQSPCLLPWLTLEQNVSFGLDFHHQPRLGKADRRQRVHQAIGDLGLWNARGFYPDELSGGMAQRAALARTLAREPEILLLDEPFSALDEITRSDMQRLLLEIVVRRDTGVVLVTHDIDEALRLADRILLIGQRPGRLMGEWLPAVAHPRNETDPKINALRLEILQTLRQTRTKTH